MRSYRKFALSTKKARKNLTESWHNLRKKVPTAKVRQTIKRRPVLSFLAALLLLFLVILASNILFAPKAEESTEAVLVKSIATYQVNGARTIAVKAQVQKTGVITMYAQTAGIVQNVHVKEGDSVKRGESIVSLSSNYQGANSPGVQAAIAKKQYNNAVETFDAQKEAITLQRNLTQQTDTNTDRLQEISRRSEGDTRELLNLNEDILDTVKANVADLQANNPGGVNDALILQTQQIQSQVQSGVVQLRGNLRNLEYQINEDNPPTELSNLQRELSLKQLEVQEKSLVLGRDIARLQYQLAGIQASLMQPASPSTGTVQRVHVVFGQHVNPGTPIATIFQEEHENTAVAKVPATIAPNVSLTKESTITFANGEKIHLLPSFVSQEAVDGTLHDVLFAIPPAYEKMITNNAYVTVQLTLQPTELRVNPLIPIDSVYTSSGVSSVFVVESGKAVSQAVTLGTISGNYIEVLEGITSDDVIILDRNVVAGDSVAPSE